MSSEGALIDDVEEAVLIMLRVEVIRVVFGDVRRLAAFSG